MQPGDHFRSVGHAATRAGTLALVLASATLVSAPSGVDARPVEPLVSEPARTIGDDPFGRPTRLLGAGTHVRGGSTQQRAPGDTLSFGYVDGDGFAILGDIWTFDHGGPDPFEGWYAADVTEQADAYWRQITDAVWDADPKNTVEAPVLSGSGSAWVGAFGTEADDLCWAAGLGYGNNWCQRLVGPTLTYDGISDVELSWLHFNDTEEDFDYTHVYLETFPSETQTELRRYTDLIGAAPDHPVSPPVGVSDSETLVAADFGGETSYRIVFEMTSDGSWSDEDALNTTEYGPAAFDDVSIDGLVSTFETGLDGWVAEGCPGTGSFLGVAPLSDYVIEDPCECYLSGNVLEMHDDNREHPYGQRVQVRSAPVDVLNDVNLPGVGNRSIFARWSQYSELPQPNGVFYRPGWDYYPFTCPETGEQSWSGRVGQNSFFHIWEPLCSENVNEGTVVDVPVPQDAEQVRFVYEVYSSCDAFAISEGTCTEVTNFTPLIDNITIRFTEFPDAPQVGIHGRNRYNDGYAQNTQINDPAMPGDANVATNVNFQDTSPFIMGDSLMVSGPLSGSDPSTQWESKLWFRVPIVGPLADSRYTDWRDKVADGRQIEGGDGDFTFAFMDSLEVGTNVTNNKYISYFREDDDDFDPGAGDLTTENEIIADGVLFPGTQVEYFVSSNYVGSTQSYLSPDTAGGFAYEFEILPRWRDDEGVLKYPCLLYVDPSGQEYFVTEALNSLGIEYDKFDHLNVDLYAPPMYRGPTEVENNGLTLAQMLGYRAVIVAADTRWLWPLDYILLSDWLTAGTCEGPTSRRGLILNGNGIATSIERRGNALLGQVGATVVDADYAEFAGDENYCVRLEAPAAGGESYGTMNSAGDYEYDVWGNWCPETFHFRVLGTTGAGVGNRVYLRTDDLTTETAYAQVTLENLDTGNYRTVIDGVSYWQMAMVDPIEECTSQEAAITAAAANEMRSALEWIFGVGNLPGLCEDPCTLTDVPGEGTGPVASGLRTHLQAPSPNPFNPRTTLRFGLAETGPVDLAIYDVGGRRVRNLVDSELDAGEHEMKWDGTDDAGRGLAAGIYWMKLNAGGYEHAARVIRLK